MTTILGTDVLLLYWNNEQRVPGQLTQASTKVALALEVAGRGATVALVDSAGHIHHRLFAKTLWGRPAIATLQPYLRAVDAMFVYANAAGYRVSGLGVNIPGMLDATCRKPLQVPALPSLKEFPLCDLLEARYGVPCQLHVDVEAAGIGEYQFGAGKGFRRLLFLTVNAVLGAALVVDGKIERSAERYIGHICHMTVSTSGPRCSCGLRGCINTFVSMDAIQRMVLRAVRRGEETTLLQRLSNREYFSNQLLAEEAVRGDVVALQVYAEVGKRLGAAAAKYIRIFEPDVLLLSGDVLSASELVITQLRNSLFTQPDAKACSGVEIVPAQLGGDAGLIGAVISHFARSVEKRASSSDISLHSDEIDAAASI